MRYSFLWTNYWSYLNQLNTLNMLIAHVFETHFNIVLVCTSTYLKVVSSP